MQTAERSRLEEAREKKAHWKKWGPYLTERQWGTVREDYSHDGDAWNFFTHDHTRSRAYRLGEDGIAGISEELAIELAAHDRTYEQMVFKFVEHFYFIAAAMNRPGSDGMWDEEDGFYYDILRLPDGSATRLKVRSLVGLLPLCATTVIEKT